MADFTSGFWHWFIVTGTVVGIVWLFWLLKVMTTAPKKTGEQVETTGHVWDENLEEFNNPLPRWWLYLFYITLFFSIGYLALYPGLGTFKGYLNWSQAAQYTDEIKAAGEQYDPLFAKYASMDLKAVATDPAALKMGERLFATYCSTCHGSDAGGAKGFPNLRDQDWLYGGEPETIKTTILHGRTGAMPAWKASLGDEGVNQVTAFVLSLSGRQVDTVAAEAGKAKFGMFCAACHTPAGTGMTAMGAPNLTDNIWLYGGSPKAVATSIAEGRAGQMPPHQDFLGEAKVHLLAAYVYSLSQNPPAMGTAQ